MVGLFVVEVCSGGPTGCLSAWTFPWACVVLGYLPSAQRSQTKSAKASGSAQSEAIDLWCKCVHSVSAEVRIVSAVGKFRCKFHLCDQTAIGAERDQKFHGRARDWRSCAPMGWALECWRVCSREGPSRHLAQAATSDAIEAICAQAAWLREPAPGLCELLISGPLYPIAVREPLVDTTKA